MLEPCVSCAAPDGAEKVTASARSSARKLEQGDQELRGSSWSRLPPRPLQKDESFLVLLGHLESMSRQLKGLADGQARMEESVGELKGEFSTLHGQLQAKDPLSRISLGRGSQIPTTAKGPRTSNTAAAAVVRARFSSASAEENSDTCTVSKDGCLDMHVVGADMHLEPEEECLQISQELCEDAGSLRRTRPLRPSMVVRAHKRFVTTVLAPRFDSFCIVLILMNTFLLGYQVQYMAANELAEPPDGLVATQLVFSALFLFEVAARLFAYGREFWAGEDAGWNFFDVAIAILSMVEPITSMISSKQSWNLGFLRSMRVLRIVRLVRIIRLFRFFRELRMLVYSILNSSRYLLWAGLLLLSINYVAAVFLTQTVSEYRFGQHDVQLASELEAHFASLPLAIYSLFLCVTGGISWGEVSDPLIKLHWSYGIVMCVIIGFTVFAVLNIITAAFVENANEVVQHDQENVYMLHKETEQKAVAHLKSVFTTTDVDKSGAIEFMEFEHFCKDERAQAGFQAMGLNVAEAKRLFCLLDMDGSGNISLEEFVSGCLRLKGGARNLDLASLIHENKKIMTKLGRFMTFVTTQLARLSDFEDMVLGCPETLPPGVDPRLAQEAERHWCMNNGWDATRSGSTIPERRSGPVIGPRDSMRRVF